jgi:methionyl-tRNA formyltransferase
MTHPFECVLVGHGTLPLACAEVLLARGNRIRAIISSDPALLRWAAARGIPNAAELHTLAELLAGRIPGFLFSIGNERLVPDESLALCKSAINYHDGPLPLYAGSHVTSWALMQRAQAYAVTWHLMTRHTDAGDILRQTPVRISSDDSALTLNAKCYEAALSGFALLADDLANDRVQAHAQDLSRRTFFHRNRRPVNGAVLDWGRHGEDLCALVRALAFGSYPNPLGFPKILLGGEFLAVDTLETLPAQSAHPPGTIAAIEPGSLVICTASCDVALCQVRTLAGQPLSIAQLVARFRLQAGDVLPGLEPLTAKQLNETTEALSGHERFWLSRLATADALGLPYCTPSDPKTEAPICHTFTIPSELLALIRERDDRPADFLLHVFLAYLARINGQPAFRVGLREATLQAELGGLSGLFATTVPLQASVDFDASFGLFVDASRSELSRLRSHRSYALDTLARHPELKISERAGGMPPWWIVAQLTGPQQDSAPALHDEWTKNPAIHPELVFQIAPDGRSCAWINGSGTLSPRQLAQMSGQYLTLLKSSLSQPDLPLRSLPLLPDEERHTLRAECDKPADAPQAMPGQDPL